MDYDLTYGFREILYHEQTFLSRSLGITDDPRN